MGLLSPPTQYSKQGCRHRTYYDEGFRDVLELRRLRIPEMYSKLDQTRASGAKRLRLEVREKIGPRGEARKALDEDTVVAACHRLAGEKVAAIAISYLHAYANPIHEHRTAEIVQYLRTRCFHYSSKYSQKFGNTNVLQQPLSMRTSAPSCVMCFITTEPQKLGVDAPIQIMKSDGGAMSVSAASQNRPISLDRSGGRRHRRHAPRDDG